LAGLQAQLQAEEDALSSAQQQHVYLQTLLTQYRSLQGSATTADGAPNGLPAIDKEIDRLKSEMADLSSRYTDRHPDVRKLKEQITKTERTRDQLLANLKAKRNNLQVDADDTSAAQQMGSLAQATPLAQLQ